MSKVDKHCFTLLFIYRETKPRTTQMTINRGWWINMVHTMKYYTAIKKEWQMCLYITIDRCPTDIVNFFKTT